MTLFSTEFWIVFQMIIILCLIILMFIFIKKSRPDDHTTDKTSDVDAVIAEKTKAIITLLQPLLDEARSTADTIDKQLIEKKQIVNELNTKLDRRVSNLNLLISRAEMCMEDMNQSKADHSRQMDQDQTKTLSPLYQSVVDLHKKGVPKETISARLSVPMCEVELVISLNP